MIRHHHARCLSPLPAGLSSDCQNRTQNVLKTVESHVKVTNNAQKWLKLLLPAHEHRVEGHILLLLLHVVATREHHRLLQQLLRVQR